MRQLLEGAELSSQLFQFVFELVLSHGRRSIGQPEGSSPLQRAEMKARHYRVPRTDAEILPRTPAAITPQL